MNKVKCATHRGSLSGYVICRCIVDHGARVAHVGHPQESASGIGSIVCARAPDAHSLDELVLVCEHCVREHGWHEVPH